MGTQPDGGQVRVLVLSNESLFYLGVENLLRQEEKLGILSCGSDADEIAACLKTFQPHMVILDTDQQHGASASEWMRILRAAPGIKLLGLSLQDNTICIYQGETREVKEVADLIEAIEHSAV